MFLFPPGQFQSLGWNVQIEHEPGRNMRQFLKGGGVLRIVYQTFYIELADFLIRGGGVRCHFPVIAPLPPMDKRNLWVLEGFRGSRMLTLLLDW